MHARLTIAGLIAFAGALVLASTASADPDFWFICHIQGQGDFRVKQVAYSAVDAHLAHGDLWALPEDIPELLPCP